MFVIGWLKQQLNIQANGLSGHLHLFWADIENSSWHGGNADGGLHERFPYWLNGIVPLAYQLNNNDLTVTVDKYINYIIMHQTDNGWLGLDDSKDGNCYWSKYLMMYVMIQYYEATANETVITTMFKYLHQVHQRMFSIPLGEGSTWLVIVQKYRIIISISTVEPLNKGHVGTWDQHFVLC